MLFQADLEHNQYRSFQGLTCLMQISTRTEDFIIDTLKLRVHIGPYLREVFKDPSKRKVLYSFLHKVYTSLYIVFDLLNLQSADFIYFFSLGHARGRS